MNQGLLWISFQRNLQLQAHMCLRKHGHHLPLNKNVKDSYPLLNNITSTQRGPLCPNSHCTTLRHPEVILCACRVQPSCSSTSMFEILTFHWKPFLGIFTKLQEITVSFAMSVCPRRTTRLPRDTFSWNLIVEYFPKTCQENSCFTKIWQE